MTVSCSERGFLLARVRDELNLTLLSYQTLYESSLAFGVRKALQAEIGRAEMEEQIEQLKHVEQQLECQKTELKVELERNAKRAQEDMESLKCQHAEEVEALQQSNTQLKVKRSSRGTQQYPLTLLSWVFHVTGTSGGGSHWKQMIPYTVLLP